MPKIYTFTAVILRDGENKKYVSNCMTESGYLCLKSGKPLFNSVSFAKSGLDESVAKSFGSVGDVVGTPYEAHLFKFGKHKGYWVWNKEASERKKLIKSKTVVCFPVKADQYDDEPEHYISVDRYIFPKEIWAVIEPHVTAENWRTGKEIPIK